MVLCLIQTLLSALSVESKKEIRCNIRKYAACDVRRNEMVVQARVKSRTHTHTHIHPDAIETACERLLQTLKLARTCVFVDCYVVVAYNMCGMRTHTKIHSAQACQRRKHIVHIYLSAFQSA